MEQKCSGRIIQDKGKEPSWPWGFFQTAKVPLFQSPVGSWTHSAHADPWGAWWSPSLRGRLVSRPPPGPQRVSSASNGTAHPLLCHPASPSSCDICPQEEDRLRGLLTLVFQGLCDTPSSAEGRATSWSDLGMHTPWCPAWMRHVSLRGGFLCPPSSDWKLTHWLGGFCRPSDTVSSFGKWSTTETQLQWVGWWPPEVHPLEQ